MYTDVFKRIFTATLVWQKNQPNKTKLETTCVHHYGFVWMSYRTFVSWNAEEKNDVDFVSTDMERYPGAINKKHNVQNSVYYMISMFQELYNCQGITGEKVCVQ